MTRGTGKWTWRGTIGPRLIPFFASRFLCLTEKESKQRGGAEQSDGGDVVRLRRYGGHSIGEVASDHAGAGVTVITYQAGVLALGLGVRLAKRCIGLRVFGEKVFWKVKKYF
jgi:hypothetical protein